MPVIEFPKHVPPKLAQRAVRALASNPKRRTRAGDAWTVQVGTAYRLFSTDKVNWELMTHQEYDKRLK